MTTQQQTERERLADDLERLAIGGDNETKLCMRHAAAILRGDEQIKQITNRFLGWKLPEDFHPDDGISFEPEFNKEWNAAQGKPPQRRTPTGTNLFSYTQAEAMVRFILADFILKGDV